MITGAFVSNFSAFKELGQSVVAATFFSSNILFWYKGGYFAASSLEKPLLHTWSLAVEEQFYLFFPILLIAINRFLNGKYLRVLLGLGFISLIGSIWGVYAHPEATYYFTPTRMWELIVGSIIALGAITPLKENIERNFVGTVGLALIFYSIFFYTNKTIFPGHHAIAPVFGAGLIIYSGIDGDSIINKGLRFKPLIFIGLISYSLYLWHWPLIAFTKYFVQRDLNIFRIDIASKCHNNSS